ncbi:MAG: membrane protein insertion efficiency factor YidD [Candidatus Acidiferrales bacterium]
MGHRNSSAQLSGHRGIFGARRGAAQAAPADTRPRIESRPSPPRALSVGSWFLLALVRLYQVLLSPFLGGACKFYPSCSNYAQEAIARHGARRGTLLALKRLGRCRPFTQGGFDPVPDTYDAHAPRTALRTEERRQ